MILWSVCLSLPATILCGRSPPSRTPVTSITAPVLSPGTQRKRLNLCIALLDCGNNVWRLTCDYQHFVWNRLASWCLAWLSIVTNCSTGTFQSVLSPSSYSLFLPVFQYWVWPWLWLLCYCWCDQEDQGVWVRHRDPGRSGHPLPCQWNDLQFQNQVGE